jgi:hypothetical protein
MINCFQVLLSVSNLRLYVAAADAMTAADAEAVEGALQASGAEPAALGRACRTLLATYAVGAPVLKESGGFNVKLPDSGITTDTRPTGFGALSSKPPMLISVIYPPLS